MIQGPLSIFLMILAVRHCHQTFSYQRQSSSTTALSLKSWAVADCCHQENFKAFNEFVVVHVILCKVLSKDNPKILSHTTVASQGIRETFFGQSSFSGERSFQKKSHSPRQLLRLNKMAQFFLSFGHWSGKQEDCREPHCVTKIDQFRHSQSQKASTPATQTGGPQKRAITILQPTKTGEKKKLTAKEKRGFTIKEKQPVVFSLFLSNMLQMVFSKVNEIKQKHIQPSIRSLIIDREGEKDNHQLTYTDYLRITTNLKIINNLEIITNLRIITPLKIMNN